ncbi:GNAT family N-acetyltransferase [Blastococcus sp. TF02A-30]|uniref:GNAT family N-acetyltransferase n=1 Tax=Blastococcus sp. TF02A-30 TaxID=2250580 RepID=UPI001314CD4B|nr:GNAT family protein [Blastococcus sp. TF02A-30]
MPSLPSAEQPTLTGPRVRLRPWRPDDVDAVLAACQDPEVQRWTTVPVPYRREDAEAFVLEVAPSAAERGGALFAVEFRDGGPLVGSMSLLALREGVASIGYWTAVEHRGRGYTGEALRVLATHLLDRPDVRRVELVADVRNTASCRTAESAGFVREGVLRRRSVHRGQEVDDVMYSLLPDDPRPAR